MIVAGEPSGDILAAELVEAIRAELGQVRVPATWNYQPLQSSLAPRFFGAGGTRMAEAGVELAFDMTAHSVIGISEVLRNYAKFRRLFKELFHLARERQPDVIVCVDFSGFNRRFAHAVRSYVRSRRDWFHDWNPRIVQYVSPQVWASREGRAYSMAEDLDLLLSIFPFEKQWYASRVPQMRVEFVGHPMIDRHGPPPAPVRSRSTGAPGFPTLLLLPGSRPGELSRHVPVLIGALAQIRAIFPDLRASMVLPSERLLNMARDFSLPPNLQLQVGNMVQALLEADLALASTGTVTLECAYFGVPVVALYRTSFLTWQIAKRIVKVQYGAMPNLLAGRELFPEFIQDAATADNVANAAIELLKDEPRRAAIKQDLAKIVASLGPPGASKRAATAVLSLLPRRPAVDETLALR